MDPNAISSPHGVNPNAIPKPKDVAVSLLKAGFWTFMLSQVAAFGIYYGINWRQELFISRAIKSEATLLAVNPETRGYRAQISYSVPAKSVDGRGATATRSGVAATSFQTNRTSVLVRNPPNIRIGENLDVYVDPANIWTVEIPGPPTVSLGFIQFTAAGFAFFFYFFIAMGVFATSTLLHSTEVTLELAKLRDQEERRKAG